MQADQFINGRITLLHITYEVINRTCSFQKTQLIFCCDHSPAYHDIYGKGVYAWTLEMEAGIEDFLPIRIAGTEAAHIGNNRVRRGFNRAKNLTNHNAVQES